MSTPVLFSVKEFSPLDHGSIDAPSAVIRDVSVITSGVTARGHNLEVDDKTLEQMLSCATQKGKVAVKTDHSSGAGNLNGYLSNFHIKDGKLKADWYLLKSHPQCAHILEMSDRMPGTFGLSAAFMGRSTDTHGREVFDDKDASGKVTQYVKGTGGSKIYLSASEKRFARCSELVTVDLVTQPAANPAGLFSAKVDNAEGAMSDTAKSTDQKLDELLLAFKGVTTRLQQFEEAQAEIIQFVTADDADEEDGEDEDEDEDDGEEEDERQEQRAHPTRKNKHEMSASDVMTYIQARDAAEAHAFEVAEQDHAFSALETKILSLTELCSILQAENDALRTINGGGNGSPAKVSSGNMHAFSAESGTFGAKVIEFETAGKSRVDAVQAAIKFDNGRLHREHLIKIGAIK